MKSCHNWINTIRLKPVDTTIIIIRTQVNLIAVGKGKPSPKGDRRPLDVKEGDVVLFGKYSGTEVKVGDEELIVMREEDILGVIEK